ncbi:MAG: Flp family type IVb pilin [Methylocystis sp.]|jgi:pilus assembly protein Flp/PilA
MTKVDRDCPQAKKNSAVTLMDGAPGPGDNKDRGAIMKRSFSRFAKDESGATAIEYGFVLLLISMVVIVSSEAIGNWLNPTIDNIANDLPS